MLCELGHRSIEKAAGSTTCGAYPGVSCSVMKERRMEKIPVVFFVLQMLLRVSVGANRSPSYEYAVPTPLSIMTAMPYKPLIPAPAPILNVGGPLVCQESMVIQMLANGTAFEALLTFRPRYLGAISLYSIYSYDLTYRGGQTWQGIDTIIYRHGECFPFASRIISSPSKSHIVLFGFQSILCRNRFIVYRFQNYRSRESIDGDLVPSAFAPSAASFEGPNSTFHILSFGGSLCSNTERDVCMQFSSDLWNLSIQPESYAKPKWTKITINATTRGYPGRRVGTHIFRIDVSLLLFGGISVQSGTLSRQCDFWLFDLTYRTWSKLSSDFRCSLQRVINETSLLQEAISLTKAMYATSVHRIIITEVDQPSKTVYLTVCDPNISSRLVRCSRQTPIARNVKGGGNWFTLVSSKHVPLFVRTDQDSSYEIKMSSDLDMSDKDRRVSLHPLEYNRPPFPGFQGCSGAAITEYWGSYVLFGGTCMAYNAAVKIGQPRPPPVMAVWTLSLLMVLRSGIYQLDYPHPGPALPGRSGHTATRMSDMLIIVYGGVEDEKHFDSSPWCYRQFYREWTEGSPLMANVATPPARHSHVAFNMSGLVVQGGISSSGVTLADLWIFTIEGSRGHCQGRWYDLTDKVRGGRLPCRSRHSLTIFDDSVILYGGLSGNCSHGRQQETAGELEDRLTVLKVHSLDRADVTFVPIANRIRPRFLHTLHRYTRDDLLLLGGLHGNLSKFEFASKALLIHITSGAINASATTIPYFDYPIVKQHAHGQFLLSGITPPARNSGLPTFLNLANGKNCPAGFYRSATNSCQPCNEGNYSPGIESQCLKCGKLLTTYEKGASKCTAYNPCYENFCNRHGTCYIQKDSQAYCECSFGYLPDDNCRIPSVYLSLLAAIGFSSLVTLLSTSLYKFIRKRRELKMTEQDLRDSHRDFQRSKRKLDNVNRGASIRWSDLIIERELEDPGRFSKLFLAKMTDVTVVVKQYPAHFSRSRGEVSESPYDVFVREAETLRSLRHPNIVTFLGAGQDPGSGKPFLVMEYLRRRSLYNVLHDSTIPIDHSDSIRFALDAAKGMTYLHGLDSPRIHRDIKSANLLVSEKWVVKVADLETACLLTTVVASNAENAPTRGEQSGASADELESELTPLLNSSSRSDKSVDMDIFNRRGMTCGTGTDRWRSPESITKNLYTEKSDVYSYGVVLWEICSRRLPYEELTCSEDIHEEIKNARKPIFPPHVRYDYRHLAERCLKTEAGERPSFLRISAELQQQQQQAA